MLLIKRDLHAFMFDVSVECLDDAVPVKEDVAHHLTDYFSCSANEIMKMYSGQVIDINASALKLGVKCKSLLAVHALSGCDTVSYPFGKGKTSAINTLLLPDVNILRSTED